MKRSFALILTVVILTGVLFVGRPICPSGVPGVFEAAAAEEEAALTPETPDYCLLSFL